MKTLNDKVLNQLLTKIVATHEYSIKLGGSIITSNTELLNDTSIEVIYNNTKSLKNILSNEYAYFGIVDNKIIIVVLNTFKPDQENCSIKIPFNSIAYIDIKKGFLNKYIYSINTINGGNLKFQITNNSGSNDIAKQKESALELYDVLNNIKN
ncbi:MAG: hypothetical protein RR646_00585 [Erysipelotrichaceae bacterium]